MGLVMAAGIALLIIRGDEQAFYCAFTLMLVATLIDATDGWLARCAKVKELLPNFDGRRLDDIIDFQTYTSLPLLLLWRAEILPKGSEALLLLPLIASAYGFCQTSAKTDDGYFLGFPSYWNIIAFYLYTLSLPVWSSVAVLLFFSLLTFVPSRYLYPSQPGTLSRVANLLGIAWTILLVLILLGLQIDSMNTPYIRSLILFSLFYPAYYLFASWALSLGWIRPGSGLSV
jgi:phosphatidylcholine synthase